MPTRPTGYTGRKYHQIPGNDDRKKEQFEKWVQRQFPFATHINYYIPARSKKQKGEYLQRTTLK
jgi:hypothetical protein